MRKIQDVLRLVYEANLSQRAVARSLGISRDAVSDVLTRAKLSGLAWPLSQDCDDTRLEELLYARPQGRPKQYPEPDWDHIHKELRRKGVTLQLLWMEYKENHPGGYQYSQFCDLYKRWRQKLQVSLRQTHRAGEKCFVDYVGPTVRVVDRETGEVHEAQLFVAVLGASNYTYVEAHWSQDLPSWIAGHVRAFAFFDGVPELLIPDNLKSGVILADRYEPGINRTYRDMAVHYGTAILPARPRKPKDKSKVENAVLVVERWILAVSRNRVFFSLGELNTAIKEALMKLNQRPFQKLEGSRQSLFETLDKPALKPLPAAPYEFAVWRKARVHIDYHIELDKIYYSVPYTLVQQEVDVRLTQAVVEIFHKGRRVASHKRGTHKGEAHTIPAHRPKAHQKHMEWTPSRLISWGQSVGENTGILVEHILQSRPHPEHGYRSCLGILSLSKKYSIERLEAASARALAIGACSYKSVKSILDKGYDQLAIAESPSDMPVASHENVRGADYYREFSRSKPSPIH